MTNVIHPCMLTMLKRNFGHRDVLNADSQSSFLKQLYNDVDGKMTIVNEELLFLICDVPFMQVISKWLPISLHDDRFRRPEVFL